MTVFCISVTSVLLRHCLLHGAAIGKTALRNERILISHVSCSFLSILWPFGCPMLVDVAKATYLVYFRFVPIVFLGWRFREKT